MKISIGNDRHCVSGWDAMQAVQDGGTGAIAALEGGEKNCRRVGRV
jgi:hypothetical protein